MTVHAGPGGPALGKTYFQGVTAPATEADYGRSVGLEGITATFDNIDPSTLNTTTVRQRNQKKRKAILVRNTSGGALLPGACVKYEALYHGRRVDAVAGATEEFGGVVDENLPAAGVPDNDLFWIIVEGETLVNKVSTTVYSDGDPLQTGASGNAIAAVAPTTQAIVSAFVGRCVAAAANPSAQVLAHVQARIT